VRETGELPEQTIAAWLKARSESAACVVGHEDLLALPEA
jgi:hypothetical protein